MRRIGNNSQLLHSCTDGTCEFFLAAVSYALLQILELVFHLLVLSLSLLALPPKQVKRQRNITRVSFKLKSVKRSDFNFRIRHSVSFTKISH